MSDYIGFRTAFRRALLLALAAGALGGCAATPTDGSHACRAADTPVRAPAAALPAGQAARAPARVRLRADAPRRYVVQKGDTLWDLAARFLHDPWHWPQLWAQNTALDNPNRIYPGETLVLTRTLDGRARLRPAGVKTIRPHVRVAPAASAIPAIDPEVIEAFRQGDRVIDPARLKAAPHIVAFGDERVAGVTGIKLFARGVPDNGRRRYQIVDRAGVLADPERGCALGTLVRGVGEVRIDEFGRLASGVIATSFETAQVGDRLLPLAKRALARGYRPHAPRAPVAGRVIALSSQRPVAAQYQIVVINRGAADGLNRGAVLNVFQPGREVVDPVRGDRVALPAERIASLMVFDTGAGYAFGLVTESEETIARGYLARSPRS